MAYLRILAISIASFLLASSLIAALSPELAEFGAGPAKHVMTKAEIKQWKSIADDAAAKAFIDLFWARRDPTPNTPMNEYRTEFDRRVRDADARFTTKNVRGAMSDRGRILLLLGPPTKVLDLAQGSGVESGGGSLGGGRVNGRTQTWIYSGKELPPGTNAPQVEINFWDANSKGEYVLSVGGGAQGGGAMTRAVAFDAIGSAAERSIVSPKLKEPRKFDGTIPAAVAPGSAIFSSPVTPLKSAVLAAAVEKARASADGALPLVWREFQPADDGYRAALCLPIPAHDTKEGAPVTIFGNIVDESGKVVKQFEEPANVRASAGDLYLDRAFTLPAGQYDAVIGAARDGIPVAVGRTAMIVKGDDGKPSVRELILSAEAAPVAAGNEMDDAFVIGGMKVVPKANAFRRGDRLWYVFQVRNPALGDDGAPKMRVSALLKGGGSTKQTMAKEVPANDMSGDGRSFWVGNSIPLSAFTPAKYELVLTVTDVVSNAKYELRDSFEVVE